MKRESLSIITRLKIGVVNGLGFALIMAGFEYFNYEPFSVYKLILNFFGFGLFMTIAFGYKYDKENL